MTSAAGTRIEKPTTNVWIWTSPFWRTAMASPEQRCLVPFTAFGENGVGLAGSRPLHCFDVPRRLIASFAGLWRHLPSGSKAYAILTTDPNSISAPIYPRLISVLSKKEDECCWPSCSFEDAIALAQPYPSQLMRLD